MAEFLQTFSPSLLKSKASSIAAQQYLLSVGLLQFSIPIFFGAESVDRSSRAQEHICCHIKVIDRLYIRRLRPARETNIFYLLWLKLFVVSLPVLFCPHSRFFSSVDRCSPSFIDVNAKNEVQYQVSILIRELICSYIGQRIEAFSGRSTQ